MYKLLSAVDLLLTKTEALQNVRSVLRNPQHVSYFVTSSKEVSRELLQKTRDVYASCLNSGIVGSNPAGVFMSILVFSSVCRIAKSDD